MSNFIGVGNRLFKLFKTLLLSVQQYNNIDRHGKKDIKYQNKKANIETLNFIKCMLITINNCERISL